jgi:1-deoxy-D-xylulose-5-phosphate reductoisomerase
VKRIVVLGSTGSIGTQTLDIVAQFPDRLQVVGLAAYANETELQAQADRFNVQHAVLVQRDGLQALIDLATLDTADLVVVSVSGAIGLEPTLRAIETGKDIALASKEVLVAAGELVMPSILAHGVTLTPIDSEHSAIFQCLQGYRRDQVDRLLLTASGGPFRGWTQDALLNVSVEQALDHPTWRMGGKITIDSATMMNKALELIEARWLFDIPADRIELVVHPQSVIHSMVKFRDGSVLGQLGWPDMRLPIAYALLFPERVENHLPTWNPVDTPSLTFESLDERVFRAPVLARRALAEGGTMPCAFNAANEEAVAIFLRGDLGFLEITDLVEEAMSLHRSRPVTLESLRETDLEVRTFARSRARPQRRQIQ